MDDAAAGECVAELSVEGHRQYDAPLAPARAIKDELFGETLPFGSFALDRCAGAQVCKIQYENLLNRRLENGLSGGRSASASEKGMDPPGFGRLDAAVAVDLALDCFRRISRCAGRGRRRSLGNGVGAVGFVSITGLPQNGMSSRTEASGGSVGHARSEGRL
jgi:hypothetical protein